jgi:hypothetical protein
LLLFLEDLAEVLVQTKERRDHGSWSDKFVHNRSSSQGMDEQIELVL